jgi:hypothetical protein
MCASCGCGKKKGEAGYGMGPKSKKADSKKTAMPKSSMKKMGKKK